MRDTNTEDRVAVAATDDRANGHTNARRGLLASIGAGAAEATLDDIGSLLDGEPVYFHQQAPEYVPVENQGGIDRVRSTGELLSMLGLNDITAVQSELPGTASNELQAASGTGIYDELTPPESQPVPQVNSGTVGGSNDQSRDGITVEPKATVPGESLTAEATGLTDADITIDFVDWTFGNGESAIGETVTTSYADAGDYEVTAHIVDDDDGIATLVSRSVTVVDELKSATNPGPVSNGLRYELSGGGSGVHDGPITLGAIPGATWWDGIDYEGYLRVPRDGAYHLTLTADKEATVHIDDEAVLNAHEESESTGVGLEAGLHEFRMDYREAYGGATLEAKLDGPGMSGEIPADALYHEDEDGEVLAQRP